MAAIGILGGTFNPIHYAHLRLAEELADALSLQSVRVIPAPIPPHREAPRAGATQRPPAWWRPAGSRWSRPLVRKTSGSWSTTGNVVAPDRATLSTRYWSCEAS